MTPDLDWSGPGRTGPAKPCWYCERPAITRDDDGRACHKVCAENAQERRAAAAANRYTEGELY